MAEQPRTRQQLYDLIRQTSKEQFIFEEMVRLGFWGRNQNQPQDPAHEVKRRGELVRKLRALRTESSRLRNREAALKEIRKRRMAESRQRREETKTRRQNERIERAEAWRQRKAREIGFVGRGVSAGLGHQESDRTKLGELGLPVLGNAVDVAQAMGISIGELRFLAFQRKVSHRSHYIRFTIPKKAGGVRLISAPMKRLKNAQRWVLDNVLNKLAFTDQSHGFRRGRSIVSNARPHTNKDVVVNLDLQDFFPTIQYKRVKGLFKSFGYSEAVSILLALLCTEAESQQVELDGHTFYVATGERHLPQGAPSSPAITNHICHTMDARLAGLAQKYGFSYTRYADDLSFSCSSGSGEKIPALLRYVRTIVKDEGFCVHPEKTRVLHRGRRQEVTGLTVNGERPTVDRKTLRRFRATLFQVEKDGPQGKKWGNGGDVLASLMGFANFVLMVDPQKGQALKQRVQNLHRRYGYRQKVATPNRQQSQQPASQPIASQPPASQASTAEPQPKKQDPQKDQEPEAKQEKKKGKWYKLF